MTKKQILLAKYHLDPKIWKNESVEKIEKWIKWFKEENEKNVWRKTDIQIQIVKQEYFNWHDIVWSTAVGIVLGIIITHLK